MASETTWESTASETTPALYVARRGGTCSIWVHCSMWNLTIRSANGSGWQRGCLPWSYLGFDTELILSVAFVDWAKKNCDRCTVGVE